MSGLERLLRPTSIVTFGGRPAERLIAQCDRMGFGGEIWPVHPDRQEIGGRACFRGISQLPGVADAAYIGVNRHLTIDIVGELSAIGCGGAICYASGFREAEDEIAGSGNLQDQLCKAAGTMPLIGPNCYGLINALDKVPLWPDLHGLVPVKRGVAIVTQSSNVAINLTMQTRGLPIGVMMTAGNQAQTGLVELAMAALADDRISALGLHMEGITDVAGLERLALAARAHRKPIVVLKVGRTETSQLAALSHTASLSGADAAADALFRRLGIARVENLPVMLETLKLVHVHGALSGKTICSMSCSGGEAALMADAASRRDVWLKPLDEKRQSAVKATLAPLARATNPLDYDTFNWAERKKLLATFAAMMKSGFDLSMLVLDFPLGDHDEYSDWLISEQALFDAAGKTGAKAAIVATLPETLPCGHAKAIIDAGVAPLCGIDDALAAIEAAAFVGAAWAKAPAAPLLPHRNGQETRSAETLDEARSKTLLAEFGLAVPNGQKADCAEDASRKAATIGFPVALKALGVAHKSDTGAVALDLADQSAVQTAAIAMSDFAQGFLVEEMVARPVTELIVGIVRDPVVGLVLVIGAGGVFAELLDDSATLTLPAETATIRDALASLKIGKIMRGMRGRPAADIEAAISVIMAVADFAIAHGDYLEELDINPLMVGPVDAGAIAADALIRMREKT